MSPQNSAPVDDWTTWSKHVLKTLDSMADELDGINSELRTMAVNQAVTDERIEKFMERLEKAETKVDANEKELHALRLNWARLAGVALAASVAGGGIAQAIAGLIS